MNDSYYRSLPFILAAIIVVSILFNAPVWFVLILALLLLLLLLAFWQGWWIYGDDDAGAEDAGKKEHPPQEYFIHNQVVVNGPLSIIEAAIRQANNKVTLTRLHRLSFQSFPEQVHACLSPCFDLESEDQIIDLYQFDGVTEDVAKVIALIEAAARDEGPGSGVTAEPNWLAGSPYDIAGSPYDIAGSPYDIAGSPTSGEMKTADPNLFMKQWAFRAIDLPPLDEFGVSGRDVRVGVFDTSPFSNPDPADSMDVNKVTHVQQPKPMDLKLRFPQQWAAAETTPGNARQKALLSSHGLFVSGLIHALAPDSDIQLIRVLENDNRGDLYTLLSALFTFLQEAPAHKANIINLSLGIRIAPAAYYRDLPAEVKALRLLMMAARCLNVVVVAAAGNHSANDKTPERANLPAFWPAVIGVAGSNRKNQRACFSNQGDIAAPAGDGSAKGCRPALQDCEGDCDLAVVGPVALAEAEFIYWLGSSFAAPMVTGLAALIMEASAGILTPKEVRTRITECATEISDDSLGAGIINVRRTLEKCLPELQQQKPTQ